MFQTPEDRKARTGGASHPGSVSRRPAGRWRPRGRRSTRQAWLNPNAPDYVKNKRQLQDVVRRAAARQPSPVSVAQPEAVSDTPGWPRPSAAERLQELNSLRSMGAITEDEYAEKRRRIIAEI